MKTHLAKIIGVIMISWITFPSLSFAVIGYSGAVWNSAATCNYTSMNRPTTYPVNKVILHTTEGSFASAVSWFQNCSAAASAHYVVRSSDGYIYQMVDEKDMAWHCGNLAYNQNSVGIEMEGYATDPSYFTASIANSVKNIVSWDCSYWGIAKNRVNIIGHNQVPDGSGGWGGASNHTDPGGFFDWDSFIQSVSSTSSAYQQLQITTSTLSVRTGPGASSPLLTTVSLNQQYVAYYQDPGTGWYLIFIPGGNSQHFDGWISNAYVSTVSCSNQVKIIGAWPTPLNIRSGPSTSYSGIDKTIDNQRFVSFNNSGGWYEYYTPASTGSTSGWSSGTYLNVFCGCSVPGAVTVGGGGTFCGSATLIASGGSGGTIYWQNTTSGGTSTSTASTSQTVTSSGTYYFRSYNSCGWGPEGSVTVTINTLPAVVSVGGGGTFCGGSTTLTASGGTGGTIYWQGTTSGGSSFSTPSVSQTVSSSGTYYFRAYNSCGWGPQGSTTVSIGTAPGSVTVSGGGVFCGSVILTATGGSGGTIYWQGTTSGGTSTATASTSQIVSSSGTYYFRAYNGGCWGAEGSVTVTVTPAPTAVTVSGGGTFCGGSTILTASGGSGGTIYWQGTTSGGTSTSVPSTVQTISSSGTYYFRAYNGGCWGPEGSATVTISSAPSAVTVGGSGAFCGNAILTAAGGIGGTIYWQGTTSSGTLTSTPSTSQTVSSSGTYYFRAYNGGCWGPEGSATVTITPGPAAVTVSGGGTFCGGSTTLIATGGGGGTVYWQGTTSGGTSVVIPSTSQTVSASGTYYFRSFNGTCWGPEGSTVVTIDPAPTVVFVSGGGTFCSNTVVTATGGAGGTIYWQATVSGGTTTAAPSASQTVTSSGTYYFRSYNSSCGWGPEGSVTVTINTTPAAVTVSGGGIVCGSATLNATGGSGGTIYWQGTTNGGTSMATPSASQVVSTSGGFYFRSFNSGCWGPQGSASVTINPMPVANFTASQTSGVCPFSADFFDLSVTSGTTSWFWTIYNGTSTPVVSLLQNPTSILYNIAGNYLVKLAVTDACGTNAKTIPNYISVTGPCTTGIDETPEPQKLAIVPNPATGIFYVTNDQNIASIEICNIVGQRIFYKVFNAKQLVLDLTDQAPGVYIITVEIGRQSAKRKIVKSD